VEAEFTDYCNCTISRAGFVVMTMIASAGWLGLRAGESATIHNCPR